MRDEGTDGEVERLLRTPPGEFVAERNRVVKALRAAGDRERAAAVAALRRPRLVDWALNVVSAEHSDATSSFIDAATALAAAQAAIIEGREGPDLRVATRAVRDRTAEVARLAEEVSARAGRTPESFLAEVTARLGELAGNPGALDLLRAGVLGAEDPGQAAALFEGLVPGDRADPQQARRRPGRTRAEAPERPSAADEARATRHALKEAERSRTAATKALAAADRKLARATQGVEQAQRDVDDATARLADATERLAVAADVARAAEQDRAERLAESDAAAAAEDAARQAMDRAR